jgi:hypothetical protein
MPRLMSVSLTEAAVVERRKSVTRRIGWQFLKAGERLTLCRKVMGRRQGEPIVRLAEVEVVSVRRERLSQTTHDDVIREGFPDLTPSEFVWFFCDHFGTKPYDEVTRIEWRYLDAPPPPAKPVAATDTQASARKTSPRLPEAPFGVISLDELVAHWRPGSYDPPWTWADEDEEVWSHDHTPALAADITTEGIRRPVLLGPDGRVWDGHHRICIARRLGLDDIPVDHAHTEAADR